MTVEALVADLQRALPPSGRIAIAGRECKCGAHGDSLQKNLARIWICCEEFFPGADEPVAMTSVAFDARETNLTQAEIKKRFRCAEDEMLHLANRLNPSPQRSV